MTREEKLIGAGALAVGVVIILVFVVVFSVTSGPGTPDSITEYVKSVKERCTVAGYGVERGDRDGRRVSVIYRCPDGQLAFVPGKLPEKENQE